MTLVFVLLEVICPNLTTAATNAIINSTDNSFGATVEILCLAGYQLNKQQTTSVNCTASGDWSADVTCQRKYERSHLIGSNGSSSLEITIVI